ncbi:MAG: phosphate ABC transporter substrate-binding protein [Hahellaceae bacterium]|nr:phosphate ABC transporter substrate-binding protein [Hahellaceae bacterium]
MLNLRTTAIVAGLLLSSSVLADIAIIVSPASGVSTANTEDVARVFLGKSKEIAGAATLPLDQAEGSPAREQFNEKILHKSQAQVKAYWSKLIFTGKGTPPKDVAGDDAVKAQVAADPKAIGYIDAAAVDASVKVILKM